MVKRKTTLDYMQLSQKHLDELKKTSDKIIEE
jgi:hypothetical protein